MDFELHEHHIDFQRTLRQFFSREAPTQLVTEWDKREEYPSTLLEKMAQLGLFGLCVSQQNGGAGADSISVALACEEMQRAGGCIASAVTPTATYCAPAIERYGSDEQRRDLLPEVAAGRVRMAIGLSEPDTGSDLSRLQTRARQVVGGDFLVRGQKIWVTGADKANYILALVRTGDTQGYEGLSLLLLPCNDAHLITRKIPKMASQGTPSCEVYIDDLRVPGDHLVGELHQGGRLALALLDDERVFAAAQSVGMAQGAFDIAHGYAYQRVQFGRPIAQHQAIGHLLADMATDVEMARLLTYRTAWKRDAGLAYTVDAAMAKLAASQIATSVANRGMQILGSYSYSTEYPMERYFRETKLFEIAGGTSQMLRNIIVKRLAVVRSD